jgi:hypothetical protein
MRKKGFQQFKKNTTLAIAIEENENKKNIKKKLRTNKASKLYELTFKQKNIYKVN